MNTKKQRDFIRDIIVADLDANKHQGRVMTRFPPEPNGYLHIGHAKSMCLNFGVASEHGGRCNLRFDDTNPQIEDIKYVESIEADVRWLGFDWGERSLHASGYFEQLYDFALRLIRFRRAYVDSSSEEEIRRQRGTVTERGTESRFRDRTVDENLDLFARMRAGEFEDGAHVLRARIDMAAANMKMRDPILYRIRHAHHYRTGDDWCIYPMYDFAHSLSDSIEGITHSLCTLEFENNRALYDWILVETKVDCRPQQIEFARLNIDYTVLSKRKLLDLVGGGYVDGWDDPRMPTLAGLRRRGVTPEAIRTFCNLVGVAKADNRVDIGLLEYCIRDDLNRKAPRIMCVLWPLKVVITNYPEDRVEELDIPYWPHDVPRQGSRKVPFSRVLYIERADFLEHPPKGFFRLAPGREVRLRHAYIIECVDVVRDPATDQITEVHCAYDVESKGGVAADGRKIQATLHWVSAAHSLPVEVRLYDRLFTSADPEAVENKDFTACLNPDSLVALPGARIEPSVANTPGGMHFQFERQGYFFTDPRTSSGDALVFNRTIALRDTWAKISAANVAASSSTGPAASTPCCGPRSKPAEPAISQRGATAMSSVRPSDSRGRSTQSVTRDKERTQNPELERRFKHYREDLRLPEPEAEILTGDLALTDFFDAALSVHPQPDTVAKWVVHELLRELKGRGLDELPFSGSDLGALVALIDDGVISGSAAKQVFAVMVRCGGDPRRIVEQEGLEQVSDPAALAPIVDALLQEHPRQVAQFLAGREGLLRFFVGQVMQRTRGAAKPALVQRLVRERLASRRNGS